MTQQVTSPRLYECLTAQWGKAMRLQDRHSGYAVGGAKQIARPAHTRYFALNAGLAVRSHHRCIARDHHCSGYLRGTGCMHDRARSKCSGLGDHQTKSFMEHALRRAGPTSRRTH